LAWEVWELKAENFNLSPVTTTTLRLDNMPTAAKLHQQIADMACILKETELAEQEEEKKVKEAKEAKKAAEAQKKLDEAEAEPKKKEAKAEVEKARKAKVQALAESKKGKSVDRTGEPGENSEGRKDCDSCRRKGWKCEWRLMSSPSTSEFPELNFSIGGLFHGLLGLPSRL
jgi:ATPase subunit of ABC transporter with duplicated ATPase domains